MSESLAIQIPKDFDFEKLSLVMCEQEGVHFNREELNKLGVSNDDMDRMEPQTLLEIIVGLYEVHSRRGGAPHMGLELLIWESYKEEQSAIH